MLILKIFSRLAVGFVLIFTLIYCNQQPKNMNDDYLSLSLQELMNASFDESGVRRFTQTGNLDLSYTPDDLASEKFQPLDDEEASCVLTFRSESPFALCFSNGQMWDGTLEYYPGLMTQDGWSLFTGNSAPIACKSDKDGYYYLYLRGEGNSTITYNQYLYDRIGDASKIVFLPVDSSNSVGDIDCFGTIESLLDWKMVKEEKHPHMGVGAFQMLFAYCWNLRTAPRITSPLTNFACYAGMFAYTDITEAPGLPSENLSPFCYTSMFQGCRFLASLPYLPAADLTSKKSCYELMFFCCDNIDVVFSDTQLAGYARYNIGYSDNNSYTSLDMFGDFDNRITPDGIKNCYVKNSIITGSTNIARPLIVSSPIPSDISDEVGAGLTDFIDYNIPKKYVCRPGGGGKIELKLDTPYSVWYLFSDSTYTSHTIPGVSELAKTVTLIQPENQLNSVSNDNLINYDLALNKELGKEVLENYVEQLSFNSIDNYSDSMSSSFCNDVITPSDEEFEKIFNGWRPDRDSFKPIYDNLNTNNSPVFEQKDISGIETPLGDRVGMTKRFVTRSNQYFDAICRLVRKVKVTGGIDKYLAIYTNSNTPENLVISDSLIESYADLFLKDGLDNDGYDKLTELFGTEKGLIEATYMQENAVKNKEMAAQDFIDTQDTITILFEPNDSSSLLGYVVYTDYLKGVLNDRCMMHINQNKGLNAGEIAATILHEFQHILYANNFHMYQRYYDRYGIGGVVKYGLMTEFFSLLAETYMFYFVLNNFKTETNPNAGASWEVVSQAYRGDSFTNVYGQDIVNIFNLDGSPEYEHLYRYFSYLSHYVLSNYGKKVIRKYFNNGIEGFDGLVAAINEVYPYADMTKTKLIADWQTAIMLSPIVDSSITFPYTLRGAGATGLAYNLWNVRIDKYGFGMYRDGMILTSPVYYYTSYLNNKLSPLALCSWVSNASAFVNHTTADAVSTKSNVATRLVKDNVPAGWTFKAIAPDLPENVMLTVVAVPHIKYN